MKLWNNGQDGTDMKKTIKNISQDVINGRQLQEKLPELFNNLADYYWSYAAIRLSMHYYAFYEAYCEGEEQWSEDVRNAVKKLNTIIKENILTSCSGKEREMAILKVDRIRKDISNRMNILTSYTDIFQTYEYVLNRLEYRFKPTVEPVDDTEFSKEILRYIFSSEDNFVINEKIREIIGQLPIRMTRQKYFELLCDSIDSYLGADQSALDTYLYMLRTSAMLYHAEGMEDSYPELVKRLQQLKKTDYKNITKKDYDKSVTLLGDVTLILEAETTAYFSLQEIVNEVYAMLLCSTYQGMTQNEFKDAADTAIVIIRAVNELFLKEDGTEPEEELLDQFTDLEGIQEEISYDLSMLEDALYEAGHTHRGLVRSMMLEQLLQVLLLSQKLLSGSLFIELEEQEEGTVDEETVEREKTSLTEELALLFDGQDRMVSRAVIANTINKMPVFFKNHSEVMNYVRYSLERCSDAFEKAACVEIINAIMAE